MNCNVMDTLEEVRKKFINSEYNEEQVYYCKECLSLAIIDDRDNEGNLIFSFCNNCGRTDIKSTDIFTWEKMYKEKYGTDFIKFNKYGRKDC